LEKTFVKDHTGTDLSSLCKLDSFLADNIVLRANSSQLLLVDFGLAKKLTETERVPPQTKPVGAQTTWSPEKAASEGYDYRSDVWACITDLCHMLSGTAPWVKRYRGYSMLHFVVGLKNVFFLN